MIPVMLQRWHEISFFHWSCDPVFLQSRLPAGLRLDTFDGKAWISLTPFLLVGLRPPFLPQALGMSFPEMNLRTYVIGSEGPAIWFFSLDAAMFTAVVGARATYGLPYFWANMQVDIGAVENRYFSHRGGRASARICIAKEEKIQQQSDLDIFLTARLRLYSTYGGRLITAPVEHPPWELNRVRVLDFEENVRRTMGVEFASNDFLAHHSHGVDTKIGRPKIAG
ncbi:MAG TPA: DUF2071 domain-containing protein [Terriglobia bacterium]|nr:DUF2071 domain-containing protein [Terriglobia bacterium]